MLKKSAKWDKWLWRGQPGGTGHLSADVSCGLETLMSSGPASSVPWVEGLTKKETGHDCQPFLGTRELCGFFVCNFSHLFFLWSLGSLALQKKKNLTYILNRAKEMVQWVECLLCKYKDLSWEPLHPQIPRTRRKKQDSPRTQASLLVQVQWESMSHRKKWREPPDGDCGLQIHMLRLLTTSSYSQPPPHTQEMHGQPAFIRHPGGQYPKQGWKDVSIALEMYKGQTRDPRAWPLKFWRRSRREENGRKSYSTSETSLQNPKLKPRPVDLALSFAASHLISSRPHSSFSSEACEVLVMPPAMAAPGMPGAPSWTWVIPYLCSSHHFDPVHSQSHTHNERGPGDCDTSQRHRCLEGSTHRYLGGGVTQRGRIFLFNFHFQNYPIRLGNGY